VPNLLAQWFNVIKAAEKKFLKGKNGSRLLSF
jgi:hypothetical protein